jgi:hypothetical protein
LKQIHKEYTRPFLLEPTKLTRILDVIHERLNDHYHVVLFDHFEVFLSENRTEEMSSLDDVFALENSRKRRIKRLLISCSDRRGPDSEVHVDFGGPVSDAQGKKVFGGITTTVISENSGWASTMLSEVEEQLERTWVRRTPSLVALIALATFLLIFFLSQFVRFEQRDVSDTMWLRESDLNRIEQIISQGRPINDEEMREVTTMQLKNILAAKRPKPLPSGGRNRKLIVLGIPVVIVIGCVMTLLLTCYPAIVFLWGDETQRYANIMQRRKMLWSIIVGVLVIGTLSSLFFEGIVSWIPNG